MEDEQVRLQEEADRELAEVTTRLKADLHVRHPELFDADGRLIVQALTERLRAPYGTEPLTEQRLLALLERKRAAQSRGAS